MMYTMHFFFFIQKHIYLEPILVRSDENQMGSNSAVYKKLGGGGLYTQKNLVDKHYTVLFTTSK